MKTTLTNSLFSCAGIAAIALSFSACDVDVSEDTSAEAEQRVVSSWYVADEGFVFDDATSELQNILEDRSEESLGVVVGDQTIRLIGGLSDYVEQGGFYDVVSENQTLGQLHVTKTVGQGEEEEFGCSYGTTCGYCATKPKAGTWKVLYRYTGRCNGKRQTKYMCKRC